MDGSTDWFHFAMWVRPFFMVWVALLVTGLLLWLCWPTRRSKLDEHARIPLNDDQLLP